MSFVDQTLTYDALQSGTFMTRTFQLTDVGGSQPTDCLVSQNCTATCHPLSHVCVTKCP